MFFFFFFKQKTAYEIRPCDWSSDVCSSDLHRSRREQAAIERHEMRRERHAHAAAGQGRSEERRVGKECTVLCRSQWSAYPRKKKTLGEAVVFREFSHAGGLPLAIKV